MGEVENRPYITERREIDRDTNFRKPVSNAIKELDNRVKESETNKAEVMVAREDLTPDETLKASSEVRTALTQLVTEYGYVNHNIRIYRDEETGEMIRSVVISTSDPNVFIERRCRVPDKKGGKIGKSELLLSYGDKELKGVIPKSIDLLAMQMRTEVNSAIINGRENGYIPEHLKNLVDKLTHIGIDIDGTIFDTEDPNGLIDERAIAEFAKLTLELQKEGIEPFFFTGRGVADVKKSIAIVEAFGGIIPEAICENGSVTYNRETDEWETHEKISSFAVFVKKGIENLLVNDLVNNDLGSLEEGKVMGISINPTEKGIQLAKQQVDIAAEINRVKEEEGRTIQKEDLKPIDIYRIWIKDYLRSKKDEIVLLTNAVRNNNLSEGEDSDRQKIEKYLEGTISKIVNSATAVDINPCIVDENGVVKGVTKIEGTDNFAKKKGFNLENGKYAELGGIGDSGGDKFLKKSAIAGGVWNATGQLRYSGDINIFSPYEVARGAVDILKYILKIKRANKLSRMDI